MCRFLFSLFCTVTLFAWSTTSNAQDVTLFQPQEVVQMGSGILTSLDWSPDGESIAVATNRSIWLLSSDLQQQEHIQIHNVSSLSWSLDGNLVALGRWDGSVEIIYTSNWETYIQFQVSTNPIQDIKWNPIRQEVAVSALGEPMVTVWDINGDQQYELLNSDDGIVQSFDWSSDGNKMVIGNLEGSIHIWDVISQESALEFTQHPAFVGDVSWQPNGVLIASSGVEPGSSGTPENTAVLVWNAQSGEIIYRLRTEQWSTTSPVVWSPDGQRLAGTSQSGSELFANEFSTNILIWNIEDGNLINQWDVSEDNQIVELLWQPDGEAIAYRKALRRQSQMMTICGDEFVGILDINEGNNFVFHPDGHTAEIDTITWNVDNQQFATGSADRTIRIWDASTGRQTQILEGHQCRIQTLSWNPVDAQLASYSTDDTIRVWDVASGEATFETDFGIWFMNPLPQNLVWNPSGNYLAATNHLGEVKVWNVQDDTIIYDVRITSENVSFAVLSWIANDLFLAIAPLTGNDVEIWRITDDPELITSFATAGDIIYSGIWSPDGSYLAVYSGDGIVQVWNVPQEMLSSSINTNSSFIPEMVWIPDSNHLLINQTLYDIITGSSLITLVVQGNHLQISPDSSLLVNVISGNIIEIWNISRMVKT
jgi:WD40 repeat protein